MYVEHGLYWKEGEGGGSEAERERDGETGKARACHREAWGEPSGG